MTDPTEYERLVELARLVLVNKRTARIRRLVNSDTPLDPGKSCEGDIRAVFEAIGLTAKSRIVPLEATEEMRVAFIKQAKWNGYESKTEFGLCWTYLLSARPQLEERSDG